MIQRTGFAVPSGRRCGKPGSGLPDRLAGAILVNCFLVASVFGQGAIRQPGRGADGPDIAVDLNEGIYLYLAGEEDSLLYSEAITVLSSVLDRDPDNITALLFRALCHGELGLTELKDRRNAENKIHQFTMVLRTRSGDTDVNVIDKEIAELEERIKGYQSADSLDETQLAEWAIDLEKLKDHRDIKSIFEVDIPDEKLEENKQVNEEVALSAMQAEKLHYEAMTVDIRALIGLIDNPDVPVRLLDIVANAKIARIDETVARDLIGGKIKNGKFTQSHRKLRRDAGRRFEMAANVLKRMLEEELTDIQLVRAKFLLGVILYRQAIPLRAEKESFALSSDGLRRLDEALTLMKALADDPETTGLFAPYSAFYVGLILPFQAVAELDGDVREQMLTEAETYLAQAARLDLQSGTPVAGVPDRPTSRTNKLVPALVAQQRDQIEAIRMSAGAAAPAIDDLRLSIGLGLNRDTNVVLLGERTDLPRDISRDEDFGFALVTAIDYTMALTDKLTFGFQGRVSQLWHADVDEFDEQTYGATVALQYEVSPRRDRFGPVLLSLQYDYDYTLLGRSPFLESHAIRPSVRVFWDERRAESELYFRYNIRDYREPLADKRFNRDGTYLALGVLHRHKTINMTEVYRRWNIEPWGHAGDPGLEQDDPEFPNRYVEGRILLEYSWDATDGDEFDRKAYVMGFGVGVPLPWGVDMDLTTRFEWGEYAHGSLIDFHRGPRRDFVQEYGLSFSRTFVLEPGDFRNRFTPQFDRTVMTIRAQASWTEDDSNVVDRLGQAVFSYDRWVYGVTVGFAFN